MRGNEASATPVAWQGVIARNPGAKPIRRYTRTSEIRESYFTETRLSLRFMQSGMTIVGGRSLVGSVHTPLLLPDSVQRIAYSEG